MSDAGCASFLCDKIVGPTPVREGRRRILARFESIVTLLVALYRLQEFIDADAKAHQTNTHSDGGPHAGEVANRRYPHLRTLSGGNERSEVVSLTAPAVTGLVEGDRRFG